MPDGIAVSYVQLANILSTELRLVQYLNKSVGIDVILVPWNNPETDVKEVLYLKKSAGIEVADTPLNTSVAYVIFILFLNKFVGIDVIALHP